MSWQDVIGVIGSVISIIGGVIWFYTWISRPKNILFIDDEIDDFEIPSTLNNHGYTVNTMKDVQTLDDEKIKNARIIFVDYKGVGKLFGSKEGLSLVNALKKKYKNKKKIILFSSHNRFTLKDDLKMTDDTIPKNSSSDEFLKLIEKYK